MEGGLSRIVGEKRRGEKWGLREKIKESFLKVDRNFYVWKTRFSAEFVLNFDRKNSRKPLQGEESLYRKVFKKLREKCAVSG